MDDLSEHLEDIEIDRLITHQPKSSKLREEIEADVGYFNGQEDDPPPHSYLPTYSRKFANTLVKEMSRRLTSKTFRDEMRLNG